MSWTLRVSLLGFVVCILAGCVEQTSQQTHTDQDIFGKMTLDEISNDYTSKVRAYSKRYRAAPTKAEKLEVFKTIPNVTAYQPRLVELINEDPGSDAGLEVVDWWYRRGGRRNSADVITRLIVENYSRVESIEQYVPRIARHLPPEEAKTELEALVESNPFDAVKASATYELHEVLRRQVEELGGETKVAANARLKVLRDSIYDQYADATNTRGVKYVELLEAVDFAPKLEIGKTVPDIVGADLNGVEFKLSDYDGKVRVISFWGNW